MSISHMIFDDDFYFQGEWFKCNGNNNWGYVWVFEYDSNSKMMKGVYAHNAEEIASLPGKTDIKCGPSISYKCENKQGIGDQNNFRMIAKCPSYPQYIGCYVMDNDLKALNISGGVNLLYKRLLQGIKYALTRGSEVSICL